MKIMVITGSRSDWSPLEMVAKQLEFSNEVHVVSLWTHLDIPDNVIARAQQSCFVGQHVVSSIASIKPDLAMVLGDRWEVLAASTACYLCETPIAHLSGGDTTPYSADEKMRDAISMLASIHFPTNHRAAQRLIAKLPFDRERIFNVGSPAIDRLLTRPRVPREAILRTYDIKGAQVIVLIAVHPNTGAGVGGPDEIGEIIAACEAFEKGYPGGVTYFVMSPNGDGGHSELRDRLKRFADERLGSRFFDNLPPDQYISILSNCDMMIGNSSSGVFEAPALGIPSIIVGYRQSGRPLTAWRYPEVDRDKIRAAMLSAFQYDRKKTRPTVFGDGTACQKIEAILDTIDPKKLLRSP